MLQWNSELKLGIAELDSQQKELFTLYQRYAERAAKDDSASSLAELFDFLDRYVRERLSYEERLLVSSKYPQCREHLEAHRKFTEELQNLRQRVQQEEDSKEVHLALQALMIRWLIKHSNHEDVAFQKYLQESVQKAENRFASKKLGEILVSVHFLTQATVEHALKLQLDNGGRLGEILMNMGVITQKELEGILLAQEGKSCLVQRLGNILVDAGLITFETLEHALDLQKQTGTKIGDVLVKMGVATREDVIEAKAIQCGMVPTEGPAPPNRKQDSTTASPQSHEEHEGAQSQSPGQSLSAP